MMKWEQSFVQANIKENFKGPRYWPFWRPVYSPHTGPVVRKCIHLIPSSCTHLNLTNNFKYSYIDGVDFHVIYIWPLKTGLECIEMWNESIENSLSGQHRNVDIKMVYSTMLYQYKMKYLSDIGMVDLVSATKFHRPDNTTASDR